MNIIFISKPETYSVIKNLTETETYRKFYVFANEFFESTYTPLELNESISQRNARAILNAALWYKDHMQVLTNNIFKNWCFYFFKDFESRCDFHN